MQKRVVRLNRAQVRGLIKEAILARQPGQKEPFRVDEAFGAYDVSARAGEPVEPGENTMLPHNFEETHKELFSQALEPVVQEFVEGLMDIYDAGFPPEGRDDAAASCEFAAQDMKAELMSVIAKWTKKTLNDII